MDDLKAKGVKAFAWDFFGKMAVNGSSFIISIFLARLLSPSEFGLIAMVMVLVNIAAVFTDIGLSSALIQRRRVLAIHYASVFYLNISLGIILSLLLFFSSSLISEFYKNEQLVPVTQAISLMFFINAFSSVQTTIFRKELNYKALAKINVVSSVLAGITGILLAFNGAGVWSLVVQVLLRGVFYNIHIWLISKWVPEFLFSFKALKQLWGFGFRVFLSGMLDAIFKRLDIIIIGKIFPPALLGYYGRAKSLENLVITYSSSSLSAVLFPLLSKVQKDLSRYNDIVVKSLDILSFVIFLLLGGLYLTSEELIVFLFSDKWLQSVNYYKILILSGFAFPISTIFVNILMSRGNSKDFLRLEIYKKILTAINLSFGFYWGIEGFLYGLIIVSSLSTFLNMIYASREIDISVKIFAQPIIIQMLISVVSVVITAYITVNIQSYSILLIIIKGVIFAFLYISINWLFKTNSFINLKSQLLPLLNR